jgi:hypothetical protein
MMVMGRYEEEMRFWSKVQKTATCWWWTGGKRGKYGGFGRYTPHHRQNGQAGRQVMAHRFAYERLVGPIPEGLVLDHLCSNHLCVNPAHLEPVTVMENSRRGRRSFEETRPDTQPTLFDASDQ